MTLPKIALHVWWVNWWWDRPSWRSQFLYLVRPEIKYPWATLERQQAAVETLVIHIQILTHPICLQAISPFVEFLSLGTYWIILPPWWIDKILIIITILKTPLHSKKCFFFCLRPLKYLTWIIPNSACPNWKRRCLCTIWHSNTQDELVLEFHWYKTQSLSNLLLPPKTQFPGKPG